MKDTDHVHLLWGKHWQRFWNTDTNAYSTVDSLNLFSFMISYYQAIHLQCGRIFRAYGYDQDSTETPKTQSCCPLYPSVFVEKLLIVPLL